jgi:hypothetical protein
VRGGACVTVNLVAYGTAGLVNLSSMITLWGVSLGLRNSSIRG